MKPMCFGGKYVTSWALALAACAVSASIVRAQYRVQQPGCACAGDCTAPGGNMTAPVQPGQPQVQPVEPQQQEPSAPGLAEEQFASLAGDTIGLAQGNLDSAPNSIGDFFNGGCINALLVSPDSSDVTFPDPNRVAIINDMVVYDVCIPTPGSAIGRVKLADNNSPMPRDRVFFDYNFFHNTSLNGIDVNRYTPGFEKTFLDGMGSFEFRMPMAGTLDSDVVINSVTGDNPTGLNGEFGDLFFGIKALLAATDRCAISAGLGLTVPTAEDVRVGLDDGTPLALIENDAVYVSPYAAILLTPSSRVFFQGFVQLNVDANGNPVFSNRLGNGLQPEGRLNEQTSIFLDASLGHWLFRDFSRGPRGVALMLEAHYSATIQDADTIRSDVFQIGDPRADFDVLDLTIGAHVLLGQSVFTIGYSAPVTDDQGFDGEIRAFVNRYF